MSTVATRARLPTLAASLDDDAAARLSHYLFYELTYGISMMGMILGYGLRIRGTHHMPRTGPVLVIANHQSYFDPVLVGLAARRHLSYLARKSLFRRPAFRWLIRMLNAVPIDQNGAALEGLRTAMQLLHAGKAVIVFPEGERTQTGELRTLQPGIHLLIKRTRATVVPMGIAGAFDAWPRTSPGPLLAPLFFPASARSIAVAVAKPIDGGRLAQTAREEVLMELTAELRNVHTAAEQLRRKGR